MCSKPVPIAISPFPEDICSKPKYIILLLKKISGKHFKVFHKCADNADVFSSSFTYVYVYLYFHMCMYPYVCLLCV